MSRWVTGLVYCLPRLNAAYPSVHAACPAMSPPDDCRRRGPASLPGPTFSHFGLLLVDCHTGQQCPFPNHHHSLSGGACCPTLADMPLGAHPQTPPWRWRVGGIHWLWSFISWLLLGCFLALPVCPLPLIHHYTAGLTTTSPWTGATQGGPASAFA